MFDGIASRGEAAAAASDRGWLEAMLDAEAALARALARAEVIREAEAEAIAAACRPEDFDAAALGAAAGASGTPVVPLVEALRDAVDGPAAAHVHRGATSQDIVDTAATLVAQRACAAILADLDGARAAAARLARAHRDTPMAGRTLLQHAVPITFGLKAAGWLAGLSEARAGLARLELRAQLGGAAGTLASLGEAGPRVLAAYAEVREAASGGSSTMPHKRNPVAAVNALACARQAPGLAATLLAAMEHEHERAAGAWQAEWRARSQLLAATGSAASWLRASLEGLEVDPARMRANLDLTGGALMAERVAASLARERGSRDAHRAVAEVLARGGDLRELAGEELLDPAGYLGAAGEFVDRALRAYEPAGDAP